MDQPTGMGMKVGLTMGMNVGLSMGLNIEMWQVAQMQQPTLPARGYNLMMGSGGYTLQRPYGNGYHWECYTRNGCLLFQVIPIFPIYTI